MDFDWSDEQQAFAQSVIRFAQEQLPAPRSRDDDFPIDAWQACANFGIQGLPVAERYGGSAADALTTIVAMEALGYGCRDNGLIFSLHAQMWACQEPIERHGSEAQKRRFLPEMASGSLIGAHAMTEPDSGSDAFSLRTRVTADNDGFILQGTKTFVSNGPVADVFLVFARDDNTTQADGWKGVSAFLVTRDTAGLSVGPPVAKMGLGSSLMSELAFDDCRLDEHALLGRLGMGMAVFTAAMERERGFILASAVGTMERSLERCVAHAREREQFGQPIGSFQAVAHRLVDMKLRLESSRLLLYRLGWLIDQGRPAGMDAAMVKLQLSEAFLQSSLDALTIFGGYGYMAGYELERDVRDAIGGRLYSGTSDIQRNVISRHLGL